MNPNLVTLRLKNFPLFLILQSIHPMNPNSDISPHINLPGYRLADDRCAVFLH